MTSPSATVPLSKRIGSADWKTRAQAYDDFRNLINTNPNPSVYAKYASYIKKIISDVAPQAQDSGFQTLYAYVDKVPHPIEIGAEIIAAVIEKGLSNTKVHKRASDALVLYFELYEDPQLVTAELIKGFSNKSPKIVASCVNVVAQAVKEYGFDNLTKDRSNLQLLAALPPLFDNSVQDVRSAALNLATEICKHVGKDFLLPHLSSLRPAQLKMLVEAFDAIPGTPLPPVKPIRKALSLSASTTGSEPDDEDTESPIPATPVATTPKQRPAPSTPATPSPTQIVAPSTPITPITPAASQPRTPSLSNLSSPPRITATIEKRDSPRAGSISSDVLSMWDAFSKLVTSEMAKFGNNLQAELNGSRLKASEAYLKSLSVAELDELHNEYEQQLALIASVKQEKQREQNFCVVCKVNVKTTLLLPCRHRATCDKCSPNCTQCPICSTAVSDRIAILE